MKMGVFTQGDSAQQHDNCFSDWVIVVGSHFIGEKMFFAGLCFYCNTPIPHSGVTFLFKIYNKTNC